MASRVRFLSCSPISRKDLRGISDALSKKEYSDEVVWGFVDVRNEGETLTAMFVERFETEDRVEDPFGGSTTYKRIQFNQTRIRLGLNIPHLEIYDGPRSIAPLLTELSGAVGTSLSFSQISIDLQAAMKQLRKETSSCTLVAATLHDISLSADVFARVAVFGNGEISQQLKAAAIGQKIVFQKIVLRGTLQTGVFKIEIASDGRIHIQSGPFEDLMKVVRSSMQNSLIVN